MVQAMTETDVYDYTTATGELKYQVVRYHPKTFRQRQPAPDGGWHNHLIGVKRILFNLQAISARSAGDFIFITEGEKDANRLISIGLTATTCAGGCKSWHTVIDITALHGKKIIILPDNDEPGTQHAQTIAKSLHRHAEVRLLFLPGLLDKGDVSDWLDDGGEIESLLIMAEASPIYEPEKEIPEFASTTFAQYIATTPPPLDPIIPGVFDRGDKVAIIASSKQKKSFFTLHMAMCLAAGRNFLQWENDKQHKVMICQFEIKEGHFHRRILSMAASLDITAKDIQDRLTIYNMRGIATGSDFLEKLKAEINRVAPDFIIFDPLYKMTTGDENSATDMKPILVAFDRIAEECQCAVVYVHHDAKGSPGDRDIRDRGAGSGVVGRDYDACITMTPHATESGASVVEVLLRNYKPQEPFTVISGGPSGLHFEVLDIPSIAKTSMNKGTASPPLDSLLPYLRAIFPKEAVSPEVFKATLRTVPGMSKHKAEQAIKLFEENGEIKRASKSRGYKKGMEFWIGSPDQITKLREDLGIE